MEQKKIATSVDVMIKVRDYEYIHVTKYSEKVISYENKLEMISKEDELSKDLVNDTVRTIRCIPDQLGQGKDAVAKIEDKIKTRIPEWLGSDPEPNIANNPVDSANMAKKNNEKAEAEIEAKSEAKAEKLNRESSIVEDLFDEKDSPSVNKTLPTPEPPKEEPKNEGNKPEAPKSEDSVFEDLFASDDDLFENK